MRLLTLLLIFCTNILLAQTQYEFIESDRLGTRELKIQLPRNYDENEDKTYPLIVVLDGDYLFEVASANVDFISYWDDMPEAIVVGVNQLETREDDFFISDVNHFPTQKGADFFEFIKSELIPFMDDNYRTGNFKVAIGHGASANFINFYSFSKSPTFDAYISLSPDLSPYMIDNLTSRCQSIDSPYFYYLSTSSEDFKRNRTQIEQLNDNFIAVKSSDFYYQFDKLEAVDHYGLAAQSLPKGLQHIFKVYRPISRTEFKTKIVSIETSPVDYLVQKYEMIKSLFDIDKQILVNDFRAIAAAINKNKTYQYFEDLAKLARKAYPETVLKNYYMGLFYEASGNPKKAMKSYQEAYIYQEIDGITKDDLLDRADQIKNEYGF